MGFKIQSLPEGREPGWVLEVDGKVVVAKKLVLRHERFGRVEWGLRPAGYDGWVYFEPGGGGAVTLPYVRLESGELLVGLLPENRPNMGGERLCVMGGFINPNETHDVAQAREAEEEAGIKTARAFELEGLPGNSNRAFWVADPEAGEGLRAYAIQLSEELFTEIDGKWVLKDGVIASKSPLVFLPWRKAVRRSADLIARSAIAQLVAELL